MFGSRIEESIYVKGLCQVALDHPLVHVDHIGLCEMPDDAEMSTVLTCLVTVRLKADELIKDQFREFAAGGVALVLLRTDQFRSLNAEHSNSHFWQDDSESQLERHVNRVAIADLRNFDKVMLRSRPMLQFLGAVCIQTSGRGRHRRSVAGWDFT